MAGMDVTAFLALESNEEIVIWQGVAQRVIDQMEIRDQNLANMTANAVGEMLGLKRTM